MIKCYNCRKSISNQTKFIWKCGKCGKVFSVKYDILQKIEGRKQNVATPILKCKNCQNFLDDGKEQIFWKCTCGNIQQYHLRKIVFQDKLKKRFSVKHLRVKKYYKIIPYFAVFFFVVFSSNYKSAF